MNILKAFGKSINVGKNVLAPSKKNPLVKRWQLSADVAKKETQEKWIANRIYKLENTIKELEKTSEDENFSRNWEIHMAKKEIKDLIENVVTVVKKKE